jgi:hypothetical protein
MQAKRRERKRDQRSGDGRDNNNAPPLNIFEDVECVWMDGCETKTKT